MKNKLKSHSKFLYGPAAFYELIEKSTSELTTADRPVRQQRKVLLNNISADFLSLIHKEGNTTEILYFGADTAGYFAPKPDAIKTKPKAVTYPPELLTKQSRFYDHISILAPPGRLAKIAQVCTLNVLSRLIASTPLKN